MKLRFRLTISLLFIAGGLLLGSVPYLNNRHLEGQAVRSTAVMGAATNSAVSTNKQTNPLSGKPVRIVIPSRNIDLPVIDGYYNTSDQSWTLTGDKAQFATLTKPVNTVEGNTFIYGHNTKKVFAALPGIELGAEALAYTDNGHMFRYRFISSYETSPQDSSLFTYQGPPKLTLQTCTGLWYQNRSLFSFELVDAQ